MPFLSAVPADKRGERETYDFKPVMAVYKPGGAPPADLAEAEDARLVPVPYTVSKELTSVPSRGDETVLYVGQSDAPPLYTDPGASPTTVLCPPTAVNPTTAIATMSNLDPTLPNEALPPFPWESERDARWAAHKAAVVAAPLGDKATVSGPSRKVHGL